MALIQGSSFNVTSVVSMEACGSESVDLEREENRSTRAKIRGTGELNSYESPTDGKCRPLRLGLASVNVFSSDRQAQCANVFSGEGHNALNAWPPVIPYTRTFLAH